MDDLIFRRAAIDALWKALYDYEDKTEKQFLESEELNTDDWFRHRIFVQNMSDIDRQTILKLPSAQQWIPVSERLPEEKTNVLILADTIAGKMAKVSFLYKDDEGRVCWTGLDVYGLNPCDWQPTHWMPLPEPY